ncbi:MAG: TonB family protein [Oligoflexia bacterium]|nr:TonB family protein [Oligoflexia bacterium]
MFHTLVIKQKYKGKFVRAYRVRGRQTTIGSIQNAFIKTPGSQTAGLVCLIQKEKNSFKILDLGSQPDVKVNNKAFTEHLIEGPCVLTINDNTLEVEPISNYRGIFEEKSAKDSGKTFFIARWKNEILETGFDKECFDILKGDSSKIQIQTYKVANQKTIAKETVGIPTEFKRPLATTVLSVFLFFALLIGIPQFKTTEPEKPKENVYTKMIFDSKILKERKKQLQSSGNMLLKGVGGDNKSAQNNKARAPESKVVSSLRQSGISSVIGRIAKQASKNAALVAKLAAMPVADASINGKELDSFGQTPSTLGQAGKADMASGTKGFKVAAVGTAGRGGGSGGYKQGSELGTGGVGQGNISIDDTESVVEGGLDRDVIARVIREHLGQIRYCYDRQLASESDLHGKVKVKFSINADGVVESQSVGETTMNNAMVEECILRRIATWKFPKPAGGTKVLVSYPFLFKSVN